MKTDLNKLKEELAKEAFGGMTPQQAWEKSICIKALCRCPEGVCLLHLNSPEWSSKCSLRHPEAVRAALVDFIAEVKAAYERANGRWSEWGERAVTVADMLDAAVARAEKFLEF